ncbi:hypothetical protein N7488_006127 [Penicillium malachiteum]|nr:hypothetical protein N7488_006127 [Penicillium malachiteum]
MASLQTKVFTLNTEAKIPAIGFGTWKAAPGETAAAAKAAFDAGYRHFDCAPLYGNEPEIGQVFKATSIPRDEYFVTTKLWSDHRRITSALQKSLDDLCLDYTYGKEDRTFHDPDWDFCDTWREMEKLLETGKVRAIGAANFSTVNLEKLLKNCKIVPAVNQTEIQPLLPQKKLNAFCSQHNIHQTAFGPLGGSRSTLHDDPVVKGIAEKMGCSSGNVLLSWGVRKGWSAIPKSINPVRITSNLNYCFDMSDEEVEQVESLAETLEGKRFNVPNWGTTVFHDD